MRSGRLPSAALSSPGSPSAAHSTSDSGLGFWAVVLGQKQQQRAPPLNAPSVISSKPSGAHTVISVYPGNARDASFRAFPHLGSRKSGRTILSRLSGDRDASGFVGGAVLAAEHGVTSTLTSHHEAIGEEDGREEEEAIASSGDAMTVSAIIFAFMYVARLLPVKEIALRQRVTANFFQGYTVRAFDFDKLVVRALHRANNDMLRTLLLVRLSCWSQRRRFIPPAD